MREHPEAGRIRRFLRDLSDSGPNILEAYFAADVVWHVGRGQSGRGTFRGIDGLIEYMRAHRMAPSDQLDVKSLAVLADDTHGAVFIDLEIQVGGRKQKLLLTQLFRVGAGGLWDEYWILEPARRAAPLPEPGKEIEAGEYFNQYWYYRMELQPGQFTPGLEHRNLGLTRNLLGRCEVARRRCLDIGTMEAAVPVLLSRRGAEPIVAVDVMSCDQKVAVVKHFTGARFSYHGGLTHVRTLPFLRRRYGGNFEVVVVSGVLYHCFGPLHTLAMARSLVRTGGLMIVETFATLDEQEAMFFNARGRFSPDGSTYFLISVTLLEYLLRYFRLKPLDCVASPPVMVGGRRSARVAVACRAINELGAAGDDWMEGAPKHVDYRTLIDWELIDTGGADPPAYDPPAGRFVDAAGSCDVTRTVLESPPLDLPKRVATIGLDDLY